MSTSSSVERRGGAATAGPSTCARNDAERGEGAACAPNLNASILTRSFWSRAASCARTCARVATAAGSVSAAACGGCAMRVGSRGGRASSARRSSTSPCSRCTSVARLRWSSPPAGRGTGSAAQLGVDAGGQSVRSCCARWVREEPLCAVDGATNRGGAAGGQRRREGAAAGRGATMKASRTLVVRDVCGAHPRSRAPRRCVHPRRCCTAAAAAAAAVAAAPAAARRGLAAAAAVVRWAPSCARRALRKRCTRQRDAQAELLTRAAALAARDGGPRFSRPAPPKDANHPCALGRRARAAHPGSSFGTAHAPRRRFIHYCLKSAGDPRGDPRFSAEAPNVAPLRGRQTPCWRLRTRSGAPTAAAAAAAAAAWVGHAGELSRKNGRGSDHRLRQLPARPPCRRPLCRSLVGDGAALRLRSSLAAAAELTAQGKTHHHLSTDTSLAPPPAHGSS